MNEAIEKKTKRWLAKKEREKQLLLYAVTMPAI